MAWMQIAYKPEYHVAWTSLIKTVENIYIG